jgi:hypothetical protein
MKYVLFGSAFGAALSAVIFENIAIGCAAIAFAVLWYGERAHDPR